MAVLIETPLGCTVTVQPAPAWMVPGVLLMLTMKQPGDGRHAEVYLDPGSMALLVTALQGAKP